MIKLVVIAGRSAADNRSVTIINLSISNLKSSSEPDSRFVPRIIT